MLKRANHFANVVPAASVKYLLLPALKVHVQEYVDN